MTLPTDHLGPIDYAVIEFDGGTISDEVTASLLSLIASGTIRLMDLAVISRTAGGDLEILEIEDVTEAGGLRDLAQLVIEVIAEADILAIGEVLEPGTTALLVVWENVWALDFAHSVRRSAGQIVAAGRIPAGEIIAALDAAIA